MALSLEKGRCFHDSSNFFKKKFFIFYLENVANRSHHDRRPSEKIVAIR